MPANPDRYEALRQAERKTQNRAPDNDPPIDAEERHVADQQADRQIPGEVPEVSPHRPASVPSQPLVVPMGGGYEEYTKFGTDLHNRFNAAYKERFDAQQEIEQGQQQSDLSQQAPLNQEQPRTYEDLKNQHAKVLQSQTPNNEQPEPEKEPVKKPPLAFNWDRDQGLEHER